MAWISKGGEVYINWGDPFGATNPDLEINSMQGLCYSKCTPCRANGQPSCFLPNATESKKFTGECSCGFSSHIREVVNKRGNPYDVFEFQDGSVVKVREWDIPTNKYKPISPVKIIIYQEHGFM